MYAGFFFVAMSRWTCKGLFYYAAQIMLEEKHLTVGLGLLGGVGIGLQSGWLQN